MNIAECTVTEKILLAAHQLEQEGQSPFSAEALIVACWQKFPRAFGLKGYSDLYPDSNKVLSSIMGERGLARRGWLTKVGQKMYTMTREGRSIAQRILQGGEPVSTAAGLKLTREQEKLLLGLFGSPAVEKYDENRKPEITFADASRFWNISESMHGDVLESRMTRFRQQLADLTRILGKGETELSNGRYVSSDEIAHLNAIHDYLEERFGRHLSLLRTRAVKA